MGTGIESITIIFFIEVLRAAVSKSAGPQKMTISVKGAAAVDPESGEKIILTIFQILWTFQFLYF